MLQRFLLIAWVVVSSWNVSAQTHHVDKSITLKICIPKKMEITASNRLFQHEDVSISNHTIANGIRMPLTQLRITGNTRFEIEVLSTYGGLTDTTKNRGVISYNLIIQDLDHKRNPVSLIPAKRSPLHSIYRRGWLKDVAIGVHILVDKNGYKEASDGHFRDTITFIQKDIG